MTLRHVSDVSPGDWLAGSDGARALDRFAAQARVLHPWIEGPDGLDRADGFLPDTELRLLCRVLARHTTTPDECFFALWDGYGDLYGGEPAAFLTAFTGSPVWPGRIFRPARPTAPPLPAFGTAVLDGPRLVHGDEGHLLFGGSLSQAGAWGAARLAHGIPRDINSPNLFWPADQSWLARTPVEGTFSLVAGTPALVDDLLGTRGLEVVRARPEGAR